MFTVLGFIELNDCAYSPDIAPTNSYPLSNLKKFVRLKNLRSDDEAVTTVEKTISLILIENFFDSVLESLHEQWQHMKVSTLNCLSTVEQSMSCTNFPDNLLVDVIFLMQNERIPWHLCNNNGVLSVDRLNWMTHVNRKCLERYNFLKVKESRF